MDYFKHYNLLIEKARNRNLNEYTEKHHIIPKCMGGSNDNYNLVNLTPEEHYLAHQLLVKMHPKNKSLLSAAMMMTANRKGNKTYGWLKRRWSEKMKKDNPIKKNPSCNARMGRRQKGSFSDLERKNISERMKINNPNSNLKPWEHPRATDITKSEWKKSDEYYQWWIETGKSYHAMAKAFGFNLPLMTHNNMIKMFRKGWVPNQDNEWNEWANKMNVENRKDKQR